LEYFDNFIDRYMLIQSGKIIEDSDLPENQLLNEIVMKHLDKKETIKPFGKMEQSDACS
jgi:hypothetical protein